MRVRFAGFGGQGIVLCGFIFGKAAMLDGENSLQTQSYGSASRGGLTTSDVSIEKGEIHDLALERFDILVTLSQQSYEKFRAALVPGGVLFYESDLMTVEEDEQHETHGVGVTDIVAVTVIGDESEKASSCSAVAPDRTCSEAEGSFVKFSFSGERITPPTR